MAEARGCRPHRHQPGSSTSTGSSRMTRPAISWQMDDRREGSQFIRGAVSNQVGDRAARDALCDHVDIRGLRPDDGVGEEVPQQIDSDTTMRHQGNDSDPLPRELVQQGCGAFPCRARGICPTAA
jgi:hypothetical protein